MLTKSRNRTRSLWTTAEWFPVCWALLLGLIVVFSKPGPLNSREISIKITSKAGLDQGKQRIFIQTRIVNTGDAQIHHPHVTISLKGNIRRFSDLNPDPGDGTIHIKTFFPNKEYKPGVYTGVIRFDFQEQSQKKHRIFHFFELPFKVPREEHRSPIIEISTQAVRLNPKIFWKKKQALQVRLLNKTSQPVRPNLSLFLPSPFWSAQPRQTVALSPGEQKQISFPLAWSGPLRPSQKSFSLLAEYSLSGRHESRMVSGSIQTQNEPYLLFWYIPAALAALLAAGLGLALAGPKGPG